MSDFKAFIEQVKERTSLVRVIGEDHPMNGKVISGWQYSSSPDSLAANDDMGIYTWFANNPLPTQKSTDQWEQGDVFTWLETHRAMDFWEALEYLAGKAGLEMPRFNREQGESERKQIEQRESLLDRATEWFETKLWSTRAALDYARSRGWVEETIRSKTERPDKTTASGAALGYSGGSAAAAAELRTFLEAAGCDVTTPEGVALVGMRGGVLPWCEAHGIAPEKSWMEKDHIMGFAEMPRLVYPYRKNGRGKTIYFHCRNLMWEDGHLRSIKNDDEGIRMHNPSRKLFGERPLYLNQCFNRHAAFVVIVEGPADAVSLGQWGYAAIALNGLGASDQLLRLLKGEDFDAVAAGRVYLGLDNDKQGRKAVYAVAGLLGGMARIVKWNFNGADNE